MSKFFALASMKRLVAAAILSTSIAGFAGLLYVSWKQGAAVEWRIDLVPLGAAFILYSITLAVATLGWHLISSDIASSEDFRTNASIYILSNAARRLPGGVWGVGSRLYLYHIEGFSEVAISIATAVEMAMIGLSVLIIMLILVPFLHLPDQVGAKWIAIVPATIVLAVCVHPRVVNRVLDFLFTKLLKQATSNVGRLQMRHLLGWLGIYAATWIVSGVMAFLVMKSVYDVPMAMMPAAFAAWIAAGAASMIVYVAPSGFGLTEMTLAVVLSAWFPVPVATATALAIRVFVTACEVFWATVLLGWRRPRGVMADRLRDRNR